MKRVYVEWLDSYTSHGWRDTEDFDAEPMVCYSVGWLVRESEEWVVVAAHLGGDSAEPHKVCGAMTIPRAAIQRFEEL